VRSRYRRAERQRHDREQKRAKAARRALGRCDGLLSARDTLALLERLLRPCEYRLVSLHYTHRDGNGVDRYMVHMVDRARPVALKTAGMARTLLGD
jgi:hypothetical protein